MRAWLASGAPGHSVLFGNAAVSQDALANVISAEFLKANFGLLTTGGLRSGDLINDHHAMWLKTSNLKITARVERARQIVESDEFGMDHVLQAGVRQENTDTENAFTRAAGRVFLAVPMGDAGPAPEGTSVDVTGDAGVHGYGDTHYSFPSVSYGRTGGGGQAVTTGGSGIDSTVLKYQGTTHLVEGDVVWRFEGPKRTVELRVPAGVYLRIRDVEAQQLVQSGALEISASWQHALALRVPYLTNGLLAEPVSDGLWLHSDALSADVADDLRAVLDAELPDPTMHLIVGGPTRVGAKAISLDEVTSFVNALPSCRPQPRPHGDPAGRRRAGPAAAAARRPLHPAGGGVQRHRAPRRPVAGLLHRGRARYAALDTGSPNLGL